MIQQTPRTLWKAINEHILAPTSIHFLRYHFENKTDFARRFVYFIYALDKAAPGAALKVVKKFGEIRGGEREKYEQIVQTLCELVIAKKFFDSFPAKKGYVYEWEPVDQNGKNPEFMVSGPEWRLLVEVKSPSLFDYDQKNRTAKGQVVGRFPHVKDVTEGLYGKGTIALPLDNKVKDYLTSAEKKFSSFVEVEVPTYGLLFICWGQRMFEAITPLSNPGCGLLTERSFNKPNGEIATYPHVSGVVVTQHQYFLQEILAERPRPAGLDGLEYGEYWGYGTPPNPSLCENRWAKALLPKSLKNILQTVPAGESLDPISQQVDFIHWL
jgi:hypothetical protein